MAARVYEAALKGKKYQCFKKKKKKNKNHLAPASLYILFTNVLTLPMTVMQYAITRVNDPLGFLVKNGFTQNFHTQL